MIRTRVLVPALWLLTICIGIGIAHAEPQFAVKTGYTCGMCHTNPTGGGMRTEFGNYWAQTELAARGSLSEQPWQGFLTDHVRIGGNLRANADYLRVEDHPNQTNMHVQEGRLYLQFSPINELDIYLDQLVAPGGSLTREAYLRYWLSERRWYISAGRMYLPFGWRLEDNGALTRIATGIGMTTPDSGVMFGYEQGQNSLQLVISEGEQDANGKAGTLWGERRFGWGRVGASLYQNSGVLGSRSAQGVFTGFRTKDISWLFELSYIDDRSLIEPLTHWAGHVEANWHVRRGHNIKLSTEHWDAGNDMDRYRVSLVWEHTPVAYIQLRSGLRAYSGENGNPQFNRDQIFIQAHAFW